MQHASQCRCYCPSPRRRIPWTQRAYIPGTQDIDEASTGRRIIAQSVAHQEHREVSCKVLLHKSFPVRCTLVLTESQHLKRMQARHLISSKHCCCCLSMLPPLSFVEFADSPCWIIDDCSRTRHDSSFQGAQRAMFMRMRVTFKLLPLYRGGCVASGVHRITTPYPTDRALDTSSEWQYICAGFYITR